MSNDDKREKFNKYLILFGLRDNFTYHELSASFRVLAKLNHPDLNRDDSSDNRMSMINEGYDFLKKALDKGLNDFRISDNIREDKIKKAEDIIYTQYKKAFVILQNALDDYFGEGENKKNQGDEYLLRHNLYRAKIEFAVLVNDLPYNHWIDDAIDKISSINKWLE